MPDIKTRGGRVAQELRSVLAIELDVSPDDCDRLAVTLGLAARRAARSGADHPLRRLSERWGLKLAGDDEANDARGDELLLSNVDFSEAPYLSTVLSVESSDAVQTESLRKALNSGYLLLRALLDANGRDAPHVIATLAEAVAASGNGAETAMSMCRPGPVRITLGHDVETKAPLEWIANREEGQDTSASVRIAGSPGTGKSQALLSLLYALTEASPQTGFVLIDYKGDLSQGQTGGPFLASIPNVTCLRPPETPIPINPFDLPKNARSELAPEIFSSTLAAFIQQMGGIQQGLVDKALALAYRDARQSNLSGPNLKQARDAVKRMYQQEGRNEDTVTLALDRLADKRIFTPRSEIDVAQVFQQRWVIDISGLGDLRTQVAFILMHFLRQVAQAIPDAPFDAASKTRSLRGIIAIDEAHNFLTQGKKTQPLRELVRIGRSKGVPVILSSQSLEDFRGDTEWNELIPNTLVFCHGVPPSPSTLQGAFRVEPKVAKKLASDCISLDQFVVFTHRHRGADNVPRELRVTPFFERVAAR